MRSGRRSRRTGFQQKMSARGVGNGSVPSAASSGIRHAMGSRFQELEDVERAVSARRPAPEVHRSADDAPGEFPCQTTGGVRFVGLTRQDIEPGASQDSGVSRRSGVGIRRRLRWAGRSAGESKAGGRCPRHDDVWRGGAARAFRRRTSVEGVASASALGCRAGGQSRGEFPNFTGLGAGCRDGFQKPNRRCRTRREFCSPGPAADLRRHGRQGPEAGHRRLRFGSGPRAGCHLCAGFTGRRKPNGSDACW